MQTVCLIWGILAVLGMFVGFIPFLGSTNWILLPFAGLGLIVCAIAMFTANGRPRNNSIAGLICCLVTVIFGTIRLVLGGGVV